MKYLLKFGLLCLFSVGVLAFIGCGEGQSQGTNDATIAEDHSGYDHLGADDQGHDDSPIADAADIEDWCYEHAVPESKCIQCDPDLTAQFKASGDWCIGHDRPESLCRLCNPEIRFPQEELLASRARELAGSEIAVSLYFRPNKSICATDGATIQFASPGIADRTGITVRTVREASYESIIEAPAEVIFDEAAATVVTSTVSALVSRWLVSPGDVVSKGDTLAILKSPEIAHLKSSIASTYANFEVERKEFERQQKMRDRNLISEADRDRQSVVVEQARAEYNSACGLLLSTGMNEGDIEEIKRDGDVSNQFALRAPASGMIVERVAWLGELLEAGRAYATIADPSAMWIEAQLTERQMRQVVIGNQLTFYSDGEGINRIGGEIIWVSRFLDPHSRTGTVRARVLDPRHHLHAGEFGRVSITNGEDREVCLVPKDAIQWEGCCNIVFVREAVDRYRPRKVELLYGDGPYYQVTNGVRPGEEVVVDGAFLLKTELKKSSIGAGCCGLDPAG